MRGSLKKYSANLETELKKADYALTNNVRNIITNKQNIIEQALTTLDDLHGIPNENLTKMPWNIRKKREQNNAAP